jgi:hypothetical protein
MSINAATIRAMRAAGISAEQILSVIEKADEERCERAREGNRKRQAKFQAAKRAAVTGGDTGNDNENNADNGVSGVITVTGVTEKKGPPHPLKENTPTKENPPKGGQKKGARIPDDWQPSPDDRAYGAKLGFSGSEIEGMAEDLRLWASAASGNVAVKRNWSSAFKGWMRREQRKRPANSGKLPFGGGYKSPVSNRGQWVPEPSPGGQAWLSRYPGVWKSKREERNGEWGAMLPTEFPPANGATAA